jgi:hypothetical protein
MREHFVHRELARHLNAQALLILDQQRPRQAVLVKEVSGQILDSRR